MKLHATRNGSKLSRRSPAVLGQAALKWIALLALLGLGGATAFLYAKNQKQQTQLQQARLELQELAQLRGQAGELEQLRARARQFDSFEKDRLELVRLRGEITALRPLKQQLEKLQAEKQHLSQSVQNLQQQTAELSAVKNQNQQLQGVLAQQMQTAQVQACMANLKTIQGAKVTWAQEHQKTVADIPTEADLFGPDRYIQKVPTCPAGGTYTLGPVGQHPRCTIEGHAF